MDDLIYKKMSELLAKYFELIWAKNVDDVDAHKRLKAACRLEILNLVALLNDKDLDPFEEIVARVCAAPLTDRSVRIISAFYHVSAATESTPSQRKLSGVLDFVLDLGLRFHIPVSEWADVAELARQTILVFLREHDDQNADYKLAFEKFYDAFSAQRRRLMQHRIYGDRLLNAQFE